MKKIGLIVVVICLILAVGTALGDEYTTYSKSSAGDPDSMINLLDPSNAPAERIPKKLMGGVLRIDPDSGIHQISPVE